MDRSLLLFLVGLNLFLNAVVPSGVRLAYASVYEVGPAESYPTIQECLNIVGPGDICNVHEGTYNEQLALQVDGTFANRLTVQRNGTDVVTVQSTTTPVVNLNGKNYWTFDGININYNGVGTDPRGFNNQHGTPIDYTTLKNLKVTMSGGAGTEGACVYIADGDHVTVTNVTCAVTASMSTGQGIDGLDFLYNSNLTLINNTVYGNASESAGRLEDGIVVSGTDILVDNNSLSDGWAYNTHPDGIVIQGDGDRNGNLPNRIVVTRNTIKNFSQGIITDPITIASISNVLIANNVIYETASFRYGGQANVMNGMTFDGVRVGGGQGSLGLKVYNNTIDTKQLSVYVLRTASGTMIDLYNNIFLNPTYGSINIASIPGVSLGFNCYAGGSATPIVWMGKAYVLQDFQAAVGQDARSIVGSLTLNSTYVPSLSSITIGRGVNLSTYFQVDKVGVSRQAMPMPWDIGAYTYKVDFSPPSTPTNVNVQ